MHLCVLAALSLVKPLVPCQGALSAPCYVTMHHHKMAFTADGTQQQQQQQQQRGFQQRTGNQASRRALLTSAGALLTVPTAALAATAAMPPSIADLAQLKLAFDKLSKAIDEWPTQVALVQLSQPTDLQQAMDAVPEAMLKTLSSGAAEPVAKAFQKQRDDLLTYLYLAPRAVKYESTEVGLKYMDSAKVAAIATREELKQLASIWGVL